MSKVTRRSRRELTKTSILDAAGKLFAERGFAAVSVRDIGQEAGVSHALVHRYVGSKRDILQAVVQREQAVLQDAVEDAPTLSAASTQVLRGALSHPRLIKIAVFSAFDAFPLAGTPGETPAVRRLIELAEREVKMAHDAQQSDPDDLAARLRSSRFAIASVLSLVFGWIAMEPWILPATGLKDLDDETIAAGLARIVRGIVQDHAITLNVAEPAAASTTADTRQETARSRRKDTKRAILDAAEQLFSQRGYAAVSVREIGERAGVSHALVHRYLGSKKDVYAAVLKRSETAIRDAAGDTDDFDAALPAMFRTGRADRRPYLRILLYSAASGLPFGRTPGRFPATARLIELAERRAADSLLDDDALPPRFVVAAIVCMYLGWVVMETWLLAATGLADLETQTATAGLEQVILRIAHRELTGKVE